MTENSDVLTRQQPLAQQVAVVTGGSGGIGAAICVRLAAAGATVVVTYNQNQAAAEALCAQLGGKHIALQAAVDQSASLQRLAGLLRERFGSVDLLVNNAGVTRYVAHDDLDGLDDDVIDEIFRVNWRGAFACVRALKPLLAAGAGGVVVNISSIAGTTGVGSNVAYCASKAALNAMTVSLARALAPAIRVVAIAPGLVEGAYTAKLDPAWRQQQIDKTPLQRLAQAEDVAEAVLAAATTLRFTTGCIIPVDGGRPLG